MVSILAWRIPWTEEPGGLQFIGLQRAGYDWSDRVQMHTLRFVYVWRWGKGILKILFKFFMLIIRMSQLQGWGWCLGLGFFLCYCYLFVPASCSFKDLSSSTRNWTQGPWQWKCQFLATAPPENSQDESAFRRRSIKPSL